MREQSFQVEPLKFLQARTELGLGFRVIDILHQGLDPADFRAELMMSGPILWIERFKQAFLLVLGGLIWVA